MAEPNENDNTKNYNPAPSCERCCYFENLEGMGGVFGACHRYPGKTAVEIGVVDPEGRAQSAYFKGIEPAAMVFPHVSELDWCGEFKKADD